MYFSGSAWFIQTFYLLQYLAYLLDFPVYIGALRSICLPASSAVSPDAKSEVSASFRKHRCFGSTFPFFFFWGLFWKFSYILSLDSELRFYVSGRVDWKCLFCLLIYLLFPKTSPGSELKNSQREIKWAESAAREKLFKGMKIDNAHAAAAGVFFCPQ